MYGSFHISVAEISKAAHKAESAVTAALEKFLDPDPMRIRIWNTGYFYRLNISVQLGTVRDT
jgi:hypothetical protein